jgi:conjugative relaxase-like TrwC/TraI family protein
MPKSASVLAYVAGDERLLTAHMQAVRQTMGWVEKTFAEGRTYVDNPKGDPIRTGHLTYALFQHDTSRKLDPQAHIHVVIANLTKVAGNWQALFNDELWKNNSLIGSVYHASLRAIVEDLGYQTRQTGKHGQFEIEGVPRHVLTAFSQRREDILAKASDLGRDGRNPELMREITKRTRDDKINLDDRDGLRAEWGSGLRRWGLTARRWLPMLKCGRRKERRNIRPLMRSDKSLLSRPNGQNDCASGSNLETLWSPAAWRDCLCRQTRSPRKWRWLRPSVSLANAKRPFRSMKSPEQPLIWASAA